MNNDRHMTRNAIITGASSGIGLGLARELARRGWGVALAARRIEVMDAECASLKAEGHRAVAVPCDVSDRASVEAAVRAGESALGGPFDLAIANAGVGTPTHAAKFDAGAAETIIRVNVLGMMYLFAAVVPSMIERRSGHFVGVASIAGYRGLPTASTYSASKAAMHAFLEASRIELAPYKVAVTTVNPGFIATAMTAGNRFRMPFLMTVDEAVPRIVRGIEQRKRVVEFPRSMSLLMHAARLVPDAIYQRVTAPSARIRSKAGKS